MRKVNVRKHATEVVVALIVVLIATFVGVYAKYRESEITAAFKDALKAESDKICQQIKTEQKHRCQLAAALLKSGLDLPTDCLVAFSCAPHESQSNKMLLMALSQQLQPLDREDDYVAFLEQMKSKGAAYPAIAPLGTDIYLLSSLNAEPAASSDTAHQCVTEVCLQSPDTQNRLSELKATCFSSAMDFLCQPGITTGGLKTIRVKSTVKTMDPNRPREKTH
jgi:hypothetical protein